MSGEAGDGPAVPAAASAVRTVEDEAPEVAGPVGERESYVAGPEGEPEGEEAPEVAESAGGGAPEVVAPTGGEVPAGPGNLPPDRSDPSAAADEGADEEGEESGEEGEEGESPMVDFRTALVSAVTVDLPNQHPTVVLRESESPRRQLSFSVSLQDGVVLSHAMRRIPTPRPLTHELLSEVLRGFDIDVVAVRLVGRRGAVYFAELDLRGRNGRSVHSCRPSDALAVAMTQPVPVPVLIDNRLFEEMGDVTPPGPTPSPS